MRVIPSAAAVAVPSPFIVICSLRVDRTERIDALGFSDHRSFSSSLPHSFLSFPRLASLCFLRRFSDFPAPISRLCPRTCVLRELISVFVRYFHSLGNAAFTTAAHFSAHQKTLTIK